jgi:hypothetical protein
VAAWCVKPFSYSDARVWSALETCHLRAYIESLGSGLESKVAEGGK